MLAVVVVVVVVEMVGAVVVVAVDAPVGRRMRWWLWKRLRRTGFAAVPVGAREEEGGRDVIVVLRMVMAERERCVWIDCAVVGCLLLILCDWRRGGGAPSIRFKDLKSNGYNFSLF